jgi:N-methylhydantoinase B/oxoprolinase/acetone carboxylase alpha subunit
MADTDDGWLVQTSFKTPKGTLINVRAMNAATLDVELEAIKELAPAILEAEAAFSPASAVPQALQGTAHAAPPAGGGTPAPPNAPNCDHGNPAKYIKGGISKAGKPYGAFWACALDRDHQCGFRQTA